MIYLKDNKTGMITKAQSIDIIVKCGVDITDTTVVTEAEYNA